MHIASYKIIIENTIPGIEKLRDTLAKKSEILPMLLKLAGLI